MLNRGDLCIIIHSTAGDEGRIVTYEGAYTAPAGQMYNGIKWRMGFNCIISSPDRDLHSRLVSTNEIHPCGKSRPFKVSWLRKLPKIEEPEDEKEVVLIRHSSKNGG